jgi:hypothetical protein
MYDANLIEVGQLRIAERQQKSMEAYRMQAMLGKQGKSPSLRQRIASAWADLAASLRQPQVVPPPCTTPQTQPAR